MKIEAIQNRFEKIATALTEFSALLLRAVGKMEEVHSYIRREFTEGGSLQSMASLVREHIERARQLSNQLTDVQVSFFAHTEKLYTKMNTLSEQLFQLSERRLRQDEAFYKSVVETLSRHADTMAHLEQSVGRAEQKLLTLERHTEQRVQYAIEQVQAAPIDTATCRVCGLTVARFTKDAQGAVCANCLPLIC